MIAIGAFASLTRLSIKALRLYNQLGLLQPQWVDPQSGYRFYGVDQLTSARMIRNMREMEMPLATIRQVLAAWAASPEQAEALAQLNAATSSSEYDWYDEGVATLASRVDYVKERLRLFYVGITRAKRELIVTWNTGRQGDATPSLALSALMGWWETVDHS